MSIYVTPKRKKKRNTNSQHARNAKAPPRFDVKAPKGAPNVVVVLLDDIGFGQSSAFGGPCKMPTLDKLADAGFY